MDEETGDEEEEEGEEEEEETKCGTLFNSVLSVALYLNFVLSVALC